MGTAIQITDANFEAEITGSKGVSIVDFGATWCQPCKALAPIIEELASEYAGRAKIAKCDIDESAELASKMGIMSVPTIIFFRDGKKVDSMLGNHPKSTLKKKIDALVG